MNDKILLIVKDPGQHGHCRVHFDDRVEFWSLDTLTKIGESKVEPA